MDECLPFLSTFPEMYVIKNILIMGNFVTSRICDVEWSLLSGIADKVKLDEKQTEKTAVS